MSAVSLFFEKTVNPTSCGTPASETTMPRVWQSGALDRIGYFMEE
jgi:hypothetical protein